MTEALTVAVMFVTNIKRKIIELKCFINRMKVYRKPVTKD